LRFGQSPCILPLLVAHSSDVMDKPEFGLTRRMIERIEADMMEAKDNLFHAKLNQVTQANKHWHAKVPYKVGDFVFLSTANRCKEYMHTRDRRVSK
ncbi:hypothetical protein BDN71DRAFT_1354250, partial [Pleurotus eryngii]